MNSFISPALQQWIGDSRNPTQAGLCAQIAVGFNRLDFGFIDNLLADECTYGSQSVLEDLEGREAVAHYLSGKLDTLRRSGASVLVRAELAQESMDGNPCVALYQRKSTFGKSGIGDLIGYTTVEVNESGKVVRFFTITAVPRPESCRRSGLFPGLDAETVERDKNFTGGTLPRSEEVTFVLFAVEGIEGMRDSVEGILPDFLPIHLDQKTDQDEACYHHSIIMFPTLDIVYEEQIVRRIEGYHPADQLREKLADLFD